MCVNCLRKVSVYNIVKKHGMETALEYARDVIGFITSSYNLSGGSTCNS